MQYEGREESENVEDQRGAFGGRKTVAVGGVGIVVVLLGLVFGFDPQQVMQFLGKVQGPNAQQADPAAQGQRQVDPAEEADAHFTKVIFHDTEVIWDKLFSGMGKTYRKPTLVLFSDHVESACGQADSAVGPLLLWRRFEGVHRPVLLQGHAAYAERSREVRPGVRRRP